MSIRQKEKWPDSICQNQIHNLIGSTHNQKKPYNWLVCSTAAIARLSSCLSIDMLAGVVSDMLAEVPKVKLMHAWISAAESYHAFLRKLNMLALTGSGSVQGAK